MSWLTELDLIRAFGLYLFVVFLVSTALRVRQYRAVLGLMRSLPSRWPRLLYLVKQHGNIFLTWGNVAPAVLALALFAAHTLASRLVWPQAHLTVLDFAGLWPAVPLVGLAGLAMVGVDGYGTAQVGEIDRESLEKYFDQAEYWLKSWTAPVVRIFTLGYINPRQMVAVEVRAALLSVSVMLNQALWWVSLQTGLRLAFGLALWLTWAVGKPPA